MHPLLKQYLDKRRKPKNALTPAEHYKASKLRSFIQMLQQGRSPTTAQLRACMTVQEIRSYNEHVQQALEYWSYLYDVPEDLHSYALVLKAAEFEYSKGNYKGSDKLFERAYEALQEAYSSEPGIEMYFDRPLVFDAANAFALDPAAAPRLVTSKSKHVQVQARQKRQAERDAKIEFLQREFDAICYIDEPSNAAARKRSAETLKKFLWPKESPYKV